MFIASNSLGLPFYKKGTKLNANDFPLSTYISGEAGTYRVLGNAIGPDVAYRTLPFSDDYRDPVPPELAVEVTSVTVA